MHRKLDLSEGSCAELVVFYLVHGVDVVDPLHLLPILVTLRVRLDSLHFGQRQPSRRHLQMHVRLGLHIHRLIGFLVTAIIFFFRTTTYVSHFQ